MNTTPRIRIGPLANLPRLWTRQAHSGKPKKPSTGFQGPEGHGEKIWVFTHRRTDQVIYTLRETLNNFHDLKQLPYNGKKTKPAKLRKDYWSRMAVIQFPEGQGSVGRTAFQKLRELKHLHEVAWPDELRLKPEEEFTREDRKKIEKLAERGLEYVPMRSAKERGKVLNAQKQNSIADMAVVLAGEGPGNKVLSGTSDSGIKELVEVTVSWANDQDKGYAQEWSSNVTHEVFEEPVYTSELEAAVPTAA